MGCIENRDPERHWEHHCKTCTNFAVKPFGLSHNPVLVTRSLLLADPQPQEALPTRQPTKKKFTKRSVMNVCERKCNTFGKHINLFRTQINISTDPCELNDTENNETEYEIKTTSKPDKVHNVKRDRHRRGDLYMSCASRNKRETAIYIYSLFV